MRWLHENIVDERGLKLTSFTHFRKFLNLMIFGQLTATVDSHFGGRIEAKDAKFRGDVARFTEGLFQAAGTV